MRYKKWVAVSVLCIFLLAQFATVVSAGNENESNKKINLENFKGKKHKPDLVCSIKSAHDIEYVDFDTIVTITVTNIGNKKVSQKIRVIVEMDSEVLVNKIIAKHLGVGKSKSIELDWNDKVEKDYLWEAEVDPYNKIKELDETNNIVSETISVLKHHSIGFEPFYHYVGEESVIMTQHNVLVNSISGNLFLASLDLHVDALQFNLNIVRVYNSQRSHILGPLGHGWTHNHDIHLEIQPNQDVIYVDMDTTNHYYTKVGNNYIPPNGIYDKLLKYPDGTYRLFILDGSVLSFSTTGRILEIKDKNDNILTYIYNGNELSSITDTSGLSLTFSYDKGVIESVTDPINRVVSYEYDIDQNLIEVMDPKETITEYDYDADHRLTLLEDRVETTLSFTYLNGGGQGFERVHEVFRNDGADSFKVYSFTYNALTTFVDNALGFTTTINYNGHGNPIHLDGPVVGTKFNSGDMEWDNGRITSYTDLNSNTYSFTYNDYGNLLNMDDPLMNTYSWDYTVIDTAERYLSLKTGETNKLNKEWSYEYDNDGNLIEITDPTNYVITLNYYDNGLLQEYSGPPHKIFEYDDHGNLHKTNYDDNNYKERLYNNIGWVIQIKDEDGYITDFDYYDNGNLHTITDPLQKTIIYEYDAEDRRISYTDKLNHITSYVYDGLICKVSSITDPLSESNNFIYDNVGNLIEKVNKNDVSTYYAYDDLNRLTEEKDSYDYTMTWQYDAVGNVVTVTDKTDATIEYDYDDLNRLIEITDSLNYITFYSYDAEGQLESVTDAKDHMTSYDYDDAGRLIEITDPMNNFETREYDEFGRLKMETAKDGTTTSYDYNNRNRVEKITDITGETSYFYDGRGNRLTVTDSLLRTTTCDYDELGRMTSVETPMEFITNYKYDAMGRIIEIEDANGHSVTYICDALGRKLSETTHLEKITQFDYDAYGNVISRTDANGDIVNYVYDDLNRRTMVDYPGDASITYAYDVMGRVTESHNNGIGAEDELYYTYDAKGQLTQFQAVVGEFNLLMDYEYDEVGNKISVDDPADGTTSYQYDALDRITSITNPYDETTTFEYNSMSRVTIMTYANGIELTNTYDENGWLTNQVYELEETTIYGISYTYNSIGRLESRVNEEDTTSYIYDDDDRLTDISYPWGDEVSYKYDKVGNRVEMAVNEGIPTTYQYNADNQLLEISDGTTYTYDDNGNVETKTIGLETIIYTYDYENRLVGIEFPDETNANYIYCSCLSGKCSRSPGGCGKLSIAVGGKRVAKSVNGETTYYFYDGEDIILEFDSMGSVLAQYTHGPGTDNPISMHRGDNTYYYLKDRLHSVVAIANENVDLIKTYTYDAWGTIVTETGSIDNPYTYISRESDEESGLNYHRNRYYNSETGRFMHKDPKGMAHGPNLYVYVNNNPVNYIDPFGLEGGSPNGEAHGEEESDESDPNKGATDAPDEYEDEPDDNNEPSAFVTNYCDEQLRQCNSEAEAEWSDCTQIHCRYVAANAGATTTTACYGYSIGSGLMEAGPVGALYYLLVDTPDNVNAGIESGNNARDKCWKKCDDEKQDDYDDCVADHEECLNTFGSASIDNPYSDYPILSDLYSDYFL